MPVTALTSAGLTDAELTDAQFQRVAGMLHEHCGIYMRIGKEALVRARLAKRLRKLSLPNFESYLAFVDSESSRTEFREMVDALTTNKTNFFREPAHFDFLRQQLALAMGSPVRIWSAGCATGEEPYSLAMLLHEVCSDAPLGETRILATDINQHVLKIADKGEFGAESLADIPPTLRKKYWTDNAVHGNSREVVLYSAKPVLRRMINFARLNLMDSWPMQGPFDAIFCRNVMIYFDKETQQRLVDRFWALLRPGGHLFVGHSESLTGTSHRFGYVQPAVYVR